MGSFITSSESNPFLFLSREVNAIPSVVCCRIVEISSPYANCAGVNTLKDELAVRRAPEGSRWCEELDCSEHQFEASEVEKNNLGREKYT